MMDIETLAEEYCGFDNIPKEVLMDLGYDRFNGSIIPLRELERGDLPDEDLEDDIEGAKDDTFDDLEDEDIPTFIRYGDEEKLLEAFDRKLDKKVVGKYFNEESIRIMRDDFKQWISDRDIFEPEHKDSPHLVFLDSLNRYFLNRPSPRRNLGRIAFNGVLENLIKDGVFSYIEEVSDSDFDEAIKSSYKVEFEDFKNRFKAEDIPDNIKTDFEEKYGPTHSYNGMPFFAYSFIRTCFEEDNPEEFWGRELFELEENFLEEFKDIEGIGNLANEIYEVFTEWKEIESYNGLRKSNIQNYIKNELMKDNIPSYIEEFESLRITEGTAIAYINTEGYHVDKDYLFGTIDLTKVLREMHYTEFADKIEEKRKEIEEKQKEQISKYDFVNQQNISEGKKNKVKRLAEFSKDFLDLSIAHASGNKDYLDSLPENQQVTQELTGLDINTEIFYNGIPKKEFSIESGKSIDKEQLRKEHLVVYQSSLESLLSGEIVHGIDRLQSRITDKLKSSNKEIPKDTKTRDYILNLDDDEAIRIVCNTAIDYTSRKQNIKDSEASGAAIHHLRDVSRFIRGKHTIKDGEDSSNIYSISIAKKNPFLDIDIGNDGGCCIGIYGGEKEDLDDYYDDYGEYPEVDSFVTSLENFDIEEPNEMLEGIENNGGFMPFYLKDRATQFIEIYKGKNRAGMALMFATKNDKDEPILLVNSIELSSRLRTDSNRNLIIKETLDYIKDYSKKSGFKHTIMSKHDYNPAAKHGGENSNHKITKIHAWEEPFYADCLNTDGTQKGDPNHFRHI